MFLVAHITYRPLELAPQASAPLLLPMPQPLLLPAPQQHEPQAHSNGRQEPDASDDHATVPEGCS